MDYESINDVIKNESAVLLYFGGVNCGVCKALQPKIKNIFDKNFPKISQFYLDVNDNRNIATNFKIFTIPAILIFFDGKEHVRKGRNISTIELSQDLKRPYNLFFN